MSHFTFHTNGSEMNLNITFNFSLAQAMDVLEEHFSKDNIFDYKTEMIIISLYVLVMAVGLCCNLMVCSVLLANSKKRLPRNVLLINLAVSDIILCVFCMPFTLLVLIRRSWFLGAFLCKIVPFVQASTVFVSASTVMAIAIDRYNSIISFNPGKSKGGAGDVSCNTLVIWVIAFFLSVPMCLFQGTVPVGLPGLKLYYKCVEMWPSNLSKGIYTIITLIAQFVVPALSLLVTHIQVRSHLNARIFRVDSDTLKDQGTTMNKERLKRDLSRNTRATMVLLIITVVFTLSWLPWNCLNILADFNPNLLEPRNLYLAFAICHMIAMSSSLTNPILYGWLNNNIRREMFRLGCVIAKAGSAFVSNISSQSDNQVELQNNAFIRSSGCESTVNRSINPESQV